jgi:hypothetical protein
LVEVEGETSIADHDGGAEVGDGAGEDEADDVDVVVLEEGDTDGVMGEIFWWWYF